MIHSKEIYQDLAIFLKPENENIRKLIARYWSKEDWDILAKNLESFFSLKFIKCLKVGRKNFFGDDLINVLRMWYLNLHRSFGPTICKVVTATKLSNQEEMMIKERVNALKKEDCDFEFSINEDILSGMHLKIGNLYIDASYKSILNKLRKGIVK